MSQNSKAKWSTAKFDQNAGFVCEKSQGSFCMFDLIPHSGSCYDFYLDPFASPVNWDVADDSNIFLHFLYKKNYTCVQIINHKSNSNEDIHLAQIVSLSPTHSLIYFGQ